MMFKTLAVTTRVTSTFLHFQQVCMGRGFKDETGSRTEESLLKYSLLWLEALQAANRSRN